MNNKCANQPQGKISSPAPNFGLAPATLSNPKTHLIRPSATFSPSDAEKENPMGADQTLTRPAATLSHPMGEGQLLDSKEVGKRLKLSHRTVSEMANEGRLPAFRVGIYLRFFWPAVLAHLNSHCTVINRQGAKDAKTK